MNNLQKNTPISGVPLVTYVKFPAIQQPCGLQSIDLSFDKDTGECFPKEINDKNELVPVFDPVSFRIEKYALQSVARSLLPGFSIKTCLRCRVKGGGDVSLHKSLKYDSVFFGGLQTCSSVWACPVCSDKICRRRQNEMSKAIDQHIAIGGQTAFVTYTHPHTRLDLLKDLLKLEAKAMSLFTSHRAVKKIWADIGCIGSIRAWEVTHGFANGWHPHFHSLLFINSGIDLLLLEDLLFVQWSNACLKVGLSVPLRTLFKVKFGDFAAEYMAKFGRESGSKWSIEREMTGGHSKVAKNNRRTPFDLLRSYLYDEDKHAGALFVDYARSFKGNQQLRWSPGLKDHFSIDKLSDEEIAAALEDDSYLLGKFTDAQWKFILKTDGRANINELARSGGWDAVIRYLNSFN